MELDKLRRPFPADDVKYKIQTVFNQNKGAVAVAYVDARHVQERLNNFAKGEWSNKFREVYQERVEGGNHVVNEIVAVECTITIQQYSHSDVGSFDNVNEKSHGLKAVYSDAFKRAAVHFGVAVSLYDLPTMFLNGDDGEIKYNKSSGKPVGVEKKGETKLRSVYQTWLEEIGEDKFGEPM